MHFEDEEKKDVGNERDGRIDPAVADVEPALDARAVTRKQRKRFEVKLKWPVHQKCY